MTNCEQLEAAGNQSMTLVCEAIMSSRGGIPQEARILDFGCGQGRHVREFRAVGYDVVGVDRLPDELHDGREHLYSSDAQGRFPFASDSFDFCYSTSVFEHVMDYDEAISEIWRVLRPGAWTLHIFPARWRPVEPQSSRRSVGVSSIQRSFLYGHISASGILFRKVLGLERLPRAT